MCFLIAFGLSRAKEETRPISSIEACAIAQREAHGKKPVGNFTKDRDVIYNTDGRGAPKMKEPGSRWRWEPFGGTSRG